MQKDPIGTIHHLHLRVVVTAECVALSYAFSWQNSFHFMGVVV